MAKTRSWSVKGIDGETRDLARDAARASGMTIGAWIDQAIPSAKSGELPIVAPGNVTGHTPAAAPTNTRAMAESELPMSRAPAERPGEAPPNYATPEVTPPDVTAPGQEVPAPAIKSNPQTVTDTDSASTTAEQNSNIGESISGETLYRGIAVSGFFRRTATAGAAARATIRSALRSPRPPLRGNPWRRRLAVCRIILTGPNAGATENCRCRTSHRGATPTACNVINQDTGSTVTLRTARGPA
jgi:hypothetical protein